MYSFATYDQPLMSLSINLKSKILPMADFETSYKVVMNNEGGYANSKADRGGETYKGIARNMHPEWSGWALIDGYKVHALFPNVLQSDVILQKLVRAFYKEQFWNELSLDGVASQEIATELFDTGVNMGTGVAATFLQRVLNATNKCGRDYADMKVDARVGPVTVSVLNNHKSPGQVLKLLNCLQGVKYIDICEHNPSQEVFMNSWSSRVALN